MGLLLVGVLLHESHEENEKDGSGGDADDDRDDHEVPAHLSDHDDVSIPHCHLRDHLKVDAGNEVVEIWIDSSDSGQKYPSTSMRTRGR